uniref:hypothetical protein n=1 Tax=Clostridium sp. NkU-1 TaxID=1095009 RepID=UPI0006D19919
MLKNTVFSNGLPISRLARSPVFAQLPTGSAVGNSMEPDAIIRCTYKRRKQKGKREEYLKGIETMVKAKRPYDLLRSSIVTPSLEAAIINSKYVNSIVPVRAGVCPQ